MLRLENYQHITTCALQIHLFVVYVTLEKVETIIRYQHENISRLIGNKKNITARYLQFSCSAL